VVSFFQFLISKLAWANIDLIEKLDMDQNGQITIKGAVGNLAIVASFWEIEIDSNRYISSIELAKMKVTLTKEKNIRQSH
jgi:hypothetical protein|tara:strand:- start:1460 stop:1699 length:240 start_codon:yes stop_codon:yes gene_type:complete